MYSLLRQLCDRRRISISTFIWEGMVWCDEKGFLT